MRECKDILKSEYQYAKANGFSGSHDDYVRHQYNQYGVAMKRMGIVPASWIQWIQNQK